MKVLVAGATGAIGRPLISALVASRREVIGITTTERGVRTLRDRGALGFAPRKLEWLHDTKAALGTHPSNMTDSGETPIESKPLAFDDLRAKSGINAESSLAREIGPRHFT